MFDIAADSRLATMWRKWLQKNCSHVHPLRGLRLCGSQVIHAEGGWLPSTCIVNKFNRETGEVNSRFFGNVHCHSPWSCPYCSPRVMAKKGEDIAAAIDALNAQGQSAVMITFTIPHVGFMSCEDTFSIIKETWRRFSHNTVQQSERKYTSKKDGVTRSYTVKPQGPYIKIRRELGFVHNIKAWEFTWGPENGWHPHIHMLFWLPNKTFDKIVDYEQEMNEHWWKCLKAAAKNHFKNDDIVAALLPDWKFEYHKPVFISKDANGKPRKQNSSNYMSGWDGSNELSDSHLKKAADGHYTPHQIMQKAYDEPQNRDFWLNLYLEYAKTTRGKRRVEFSKGGKPYLGQIIRKWKQSQPYVETLKKKFMDSAAVTEVVCWFNESQWQRICYLELFHGETIRPLLLEKAMMVNGRKLIEDFLRSKYDIDISGNEDRHLNQFYQLLTA